LIHTGPYDIRVFRNIENRMQRAKKSPNAMDIFNEVQNEERKTSQEIDLSRTEIDLRKFARNMAKLKQ